MDDYIVAELREKVKEAFEEAFQKFLDMDQGADALRVRKIQKDIEQTLEK